MFLDLLLYFSFLFSHREGGKKTMGGHVRGRRFMQGASTSFIAPQCNNEEPKRQAPTGTVKGMVNTSLHAIPTPRTTCPLHREIRQLYPKWAPQLSWAC
jgi:hypothetical protein